MSHKKSSLQQGPRVDARSPKRSAGLVRWSALASLLFASTSLAQPAGLPRFELERLELNPNGKGSLLMGTGEQMEAGSFRLSLLGQYEREPLVAYWEEGGADTRMGSPVKNRVTAHLLGAWAPKRWLELGVQLPVVAWQGGDDLSARNLGTVARTGLSTPLVHVRLGLLSQQRNAPMDLAMELGTGLPLGSVNTLSRDSGLRFSPKVMAGRNFGALRVGVEAGMLVRRSVPVIDNVVGSEMRLGAVLATTGPKLRGELNVRGTVPLTSSPASMELLGGLRMPVGRSTELYALGGPGFGDAPGTPAFRMLLGMAVGGGGRPGPSPRDSDGDGVMDGQDRCLHEKGPAENQGCPLPGPGPQGGPSGGDNVMCPASTSTLIPFPTPTLNSSCSLTDSDKDGLLDGVDKCPNEAGPPERQGCPVKDTDNDGVVDDRDECPTVKGLVELKGCPETPKEPGNGGVIVKNCQLKINQQVFFATNKSTIQPKSFKILSEVARTLRAYPQIDRLLIAGHTDNQPSRKVDNHGLSEDRANAVQRYLVENGGVEPSRLRTKGFGPDQPIDSNDTAKGRAANRRVEFIIDTPECNQLYGRQ